jgi:hypothetical protein
MIIILNNVLFVIIRLKGEKNQANAHLEGQKLQGRAAGRQAGRKGRKGGREGGREGGPTFVSSSDSVRSVIT